MTFLLLASALAPAQQSVCAQVTLQLSQQAVLTRAAFNGTLVISNNSTSPVSQLGVALNIENANHQPANSLFGVPPPVLNGLNAVNGTGTLAAGTSGTAMWTIVPTPEAAPAGPTNYFVSGTLSYLVGGTPVRLPLYPAPIQVYPDASLVVNYFIQHDVYGPDPFAPVSQPPQPFGLGLIVTNTGAGAASALSITSAQPQIISNVKGLLISFQIIGTQVGAQQVQPSLTVDLGNIAPGASAEAVFLLTASLEGQFISYDASFQHVNDFGNPETSLVSSVKIHEMTHVVQIDVPTDNGVPDFLVNDGTNVNGLPNKLYSSSGPVFPVTSGTVGTVSGAPAPGSMQVTLTAPLASGWAYLEINDPAQGEYPLVSVVRSDGRQILVGPNAWTTQYTDHTPGQPAMTEDLFHLLDYDSTGSYTLTYGQQPMGIQLSSNIYAAPQGPGHAVITVLRTGETSAAASVNIATSNGTALSGTDYTAVSGLVTFAKGQTAKTLTIPILKSKPNEPAEPGETFTVALSGATGATLGTPSSATVTIASTQPTSFKAYAGTYRGLFQTGTASNGLTGFLRITLLTTGRFTAAIRVGGQIYSFTGRFDSSGLYAGMIPAGSNGPILVNLQLDLVNGTDQITGTLSQGGLSAALVTDLSGFNATSNPAMQAGAYTVSFPHPSDPTLPQGDGYGTVNVDASGNLRFQGALGDGTTVSQGTGISGAGTWPLYLSLYGGTGYATGLLTFEAVSDPNDLDGTVTWFKPANPKAAMYPAGFSASIPLIGSLYEVPPSGTQALYFPTPPNSGTVTLNGSDLTAPLTYTVSLGTNNKVTVTPPGDGLRMQIRLGTGRFTGSFMDPSGKIRLFNGVLLQKQDTAAGLFLGNDQSGYIELTPSY